MEFITLDGVRLELRHIAAAPDHQRHPPRAPIVFLHEGLGSVAQWHQREGYWPELLCAATGRTGIIYSRRGYGQSDAVPSVRGPSAVVNGQRQGRLLPDYLHHEAWEVLPALLKALGIQRPVLLGHSDGASIALLHASRFPVEACLVLAPHVLVEELSIASITKARDAYLHTANDANGLRAKLARHHADVDCAFWQWNDVWLSHAFRSFDIRADCARITAPVLAIQGYDDPYGTMEQMDAIANALQPTILNKNIAEPAWNGAIVLQKLEQCGHAPQRDQCALTTQLINEFLQTLSDHSP